MFFSMKVLVFLASGILEDGSVAFFHMNLQAFFKQNCIFKESVWFFGFRHFARWFCALAYEFISIKKKNCFFSESVVFLASGILEDGSVAFFHMNL